MQSSFFGRIICFLSVSFVLGPRGLLSTAVHADSPSRQHAAFSEKRHALLEDLRFELTQLSDRCRADNLVQAADDLVILTQTLTADAPPAPPPNLHQLPVSPSLSPEERQWRERMNSIRSASAKELYSLGRKALRNRLPSLAYQLIQDVLRVEPDHELARSVIGQQFFRDRLRTDDPLYDGEWVTPWEAEMRGGRTPHIPDERFGWIPRSDLTRYESGERPWGSTWISKEKADQLHRDFRQAWEFPSEHFLVKTNVGLEEGVLLSLRLELFHGWLTQNFAAFFDTPQVLQERFENAHRRKRSSATKPMEVFYFASREEYNRQMQGKIPPRVPTNGMYWQPDRRCYFFRNEDGSDLTTLYHEATHQILDIHTARDRVTASRMLARRLNQRPQEWVLCGNSNFWLIEGLACYFESFSVEDGAISVGRPDYVRFNAAQHRLLVDNFYVPLEELCRLGKEDFQQHPNIAPLYSQASGVAHFMMHYDNGRYRDDFVELLSAVYRPDPASPELVPDLSRITGVPYRQLDQEYRDHMTTVAAANPKAAAL